MTEKQFETQVKKFLDSHGIWYIKYWGGGFAKAGIPDLLCCIGGRFVAVELKSATGRPTELQKYNIRNIKKNGGLAMVLYPKQFEEFKIMVESLLERRMSY